VTVPKAKAATTATKENLICRSFLLPGDLIGASSEPFVFTSRLNCEWVTNGDTLGRAGSFVIIDSKNDGSTDAVPATQRRTNRTREFDYQWFHLAPLCSSLFDGRVARRGRPDRS
jgi:hypothetical protein